MKMNMMTETTFSHDSDLEEAVIGACMIERAAMPLVADKLRPEMFYEEKNLEIFAALQSMYRSAKSIDTITLKNELAARGKLDAVGGPYELLRISSKVSSSAHLEYHALILRQLHTRRIMRTGFQQLLAFSADESMDIDDILVEAHRLLEGLEDESGVADHLRSIDRVILLTACSLDEQRIQGYDGGADSYISKPFNSQLLLSRVRNLIANRRQLRQFFGDNQTIEKETISDLDKGFVSRFKSLVEERMKDAELNVEDLGRNMGMSRVQLYRKLKSLTNYSPNELLRQMRLKKAASLLASSDMTVAEIAYEVGFSSPSYFTKCYKEQFGESPTEFLKRRG